MKKVKQVSKSILTCAVCLSAAIIIAFVFKYNKKADPDEIFLLKAQIEGSKILIRQYDAKISDCNSFVYFKNDSIENNHGDQDILKSGVDKLQSDIVEYQKAIIVYKKMMVKDSLAYNKITGKK